MMSHAEKIQRIDKQLAQETKELHHLLMSRPPSAKRKAVVALTVRFDQGKTPVPVIGKGDDGKVFKIERDGKQIAVKIMDKHPALSFPASRAFIAKDQMEREFKALDLIKKHPNFCELYSTEVDEFKVSTKEEDTPTIQYKPSGADGTYAFRMSYGKNRGEIITDHDAWAIQMSFEANLARIADVKDFLGWDHKSKCVEPRCASAVFMHILAQMADSLRKLQTLKIRHRDLDRCNVKLQVPEMTLKIFDFARADLPDTTSPNAMMQFSFDLPIEEEDRGLSDSLKRIMADALKMKRTNQLALFRTAYIVPSTLNPERWLGKTREPSDFEALGKIINEDLRLSNPILERLAESDSEAYEKYNTRVSYFLLGKWLTVDDLPVIERHLYNDHLLRAVQFYSSLLEDLGQEDALEYLENKQGPPLSLRCNLADATDPVNSDWCSDDLNSIIKQLIQSHDGVPPVKNLDDLQDISSYIDDGHDPTYAVENYIEEVVEPFLEEKAHGSCSKEDLPQLELFYKLKRIHRRMTGSDSLEVDYFSNVEFYD
jgi:serine/threonine protein kinase